MTMSRLTKHIAVALTGAALLLGAGAGHAQEWPAKGIRIVLPFPAGSATDLIARLVAREVADTLGQPVIVDNRPGAGGAIAAELVARSAPDGYTLFVASNTQYAANVSLYRKLVYDPVKDFTPIARLSTQPTALLVRTNFPAQTLEQFISHVRANPKKLSAGYGASSSQVAVARLQRLAGLDVIGVPYKGIPLAVADVIGGTVDFTFGDLGAAIGQVGGGKLRAIAVTSATRSPLVPDWPAVAEMFPGYEVVGWHAMTAPAGTPKPIVDRLHEACVKALAKREVVDALAKLGVTPAPLAPAELGAFIQAEIARWAEMIKEAGITPE
jgi:tripartite-type tricarboxylate transporter receptor subunit TctC